MLIDWFSFFIGLGVGVLIFNISSLLNSYLKLKDAEKKLKAVDVKLEDFKQKLEVKKNRVAEKIKEAKK